VYRFPAVDNGELSRNGFRLLLLRINFIDVPPERAGLSVGDLFERRAIDNYLFREGSVLYFPSTSSPRRTDAGITRQCTPQFHSLEWRREISTRRASASCLSRNGTTTTCSLMGRSSAKSSRPTRRRSVHLGCGRRTLSIMRTRGKGLSLPFRTRMGQKEQPRCVGSDAEGRGGLELSRCPHNPEHDCRYEAHGE
jgi:hypothetical protein